MVDLAADSGVFIRSMATRGALGGLCRAAADAADLLCASGKQLVIIETVGVGQDEVDIMRVAHTTVVVSVPGLGDDIQALKAGIIEIADIHVVNKADREGANRTVAELRAVLAMMGSAAGRWQPPITSCIASKGVGVAQLLDEIQGHFAHLHRSGEIRLRERQIAEWRVVQLAQAFVAAMVRPTVAPSDDTINQAIERVANRELSPYQCARALLTRASERDQVPSHV
jgi:LAO/AO transport system kinase